MISSKWAKKTQRDEAFFCEHQTSPKVVWDADILPFNCGDNLEYWLSMFLRKVHAPLLQLELCLLLWPSQLYLLIMHSSLDVIQNKNAFISLNCRRYCPTIAYPFTGLIQKDLHFKRSCPLKSSCNHSPSPLCLLTSLKGCALSNARNFIPFFKVSVLSNMLGMYQHITNFSSLNRLCVLWWFIDLLFFTFIVIKNFHVAVLICI